MLRAPSSLPENTSSWAALAIVPSGFQMDSLPARSSTKTLSSLVTSIEMTPSDETGIFTRWYAESGGMRVGSSCSQTGTGTSLF
jgi:hypothetical protein